MSRKRRLCIHLIGQVRYFGDLANLDAFYKQSMAEAYGGVDSGSGSTSSLYHGCSISVAANHEGYIKHFFVKLTLQWELRSKIPCEEEPQLAKLPNVLAP